MLKPLGLTANSIFKTVIGKSYSIILDLKDQLDSGNYFHFPVSHVLGGESVDFNQVQEPKVVAGSIKGVLQLILKIELLKTFLRELPEAVVTFELYDAFIDAASNNFLKEFLHT